MLALTGYSDSALLTKSSGVYDGMSAVDYFPTPPTPMADLLVAINQYQEARVAASSRDRQAIIVKNQKKRQLISILISLGSYVTLASAGDRDKLAASGFTIRKINQPRPPLEAPGGITATDGVNSGEIKTSVTAVKGASDYVHSCTPTPVTESSVWTTINSTSRTCVFKGLTKKVEYLFRVGAVGPRGQITYSATITRVCQ